MKSTWFACLSLVVAIPAAAAGPSAVAKTDRSLWPEVLDSAAAYNRASRAEILVFAAALAEVSEQDEATLKTELRIKSADLVSVKRVRDRLSGILVENLKAAGKTCTAGELFCGAVDSRRALAEAARSFDARLPAEFRPWLDNAHHFHYLYASELIRLAALFPKVSSEIDTFHAEERQGFELADGHFLLTFDDGPSKTAGNTDVLLKLLSQHSLHATFYILGERLLERKQAQGTAALQSLYDNQCLALHGWQHQSHEKWSAWQTSVLDTQRLTKEVFASASRPYFRPPYGQRRSDSGEFFKANGLKVALWNIDSQDWNSNVSGADAAQRVLTLMLLWRRGIVLFHDVHSKALTAVPWLLAQTRAAGISWDDCRQY